MPKVIACSRRRPGLTQEDYRRYLQHVHGSISHKFAQPGMGFYYQNHVLDAAYGSIADQENQLLPRDGAVELWFESFPKLFSVFMHPDVEKWVASDGKFFCEEAVTLLAITEEKEFPVPNPVDTFNPGYGLAPGRGDGKVMQFIKRADGIFLEDYQQYWVEAHEAAMQACPFFKDNIRRYVQSHRLAQTNNVQGHFKNRDDLPTYDGVASYWFDTPDYFGAFRQYNDHLQAYPKRWADWSRSFFLYVKEVPIHYTER